MSELPQISVSGLTMAYDQQVIQQDLTFSVRRGDIFVIMGGSGCGKSTLMRHLVGLKKPCAGSVCYDQVDFWAQSPSQQRRIMWNWGILYQGGALWSSMTLAENIAVPLKEYTELNASQVRDVIELKLALVGLAGFQDYYPSELSGGMQKRAGLARAMALDPEILFCDEPTSGLDPVSARRLDQLILELRESLDTTVVVVSHDLASIYAIASNGLFLDGESRTMLATGTPRQMLDAGNLKVGEFLTRGKEPETET